MADSPLGLQSKLWGFGVLIIGSSMAKIGCSNARPPGRLCRRETVRVIEVFIGSGPPGFSGMRRRHGPPYPTARIPTATNRSSHRRRTEPTNTVAGGPTRRSRFPKDMAAIGRCRQLWSSPAKPRAVVAIRQQVKADNPQNTVARSPAVGDASIHVTGPDAQDIAEASVGRRSPPQCGNRHVQAPTGLRSDPVDGQDHLHNVRSPSRRASIVARGDQPGAHTPHGVRPARRARSRGPASGPGSWEGTADRPRSTSSGQSGPPATYPPHTRRPNQTRITQDPPRARTSNPVRQPRRIISRRPSAPTPGCGHYTLGPNRWAHTRTQGQPRAPPAYNPKRMIAIWGLARSEPIASWPHAPADLPAPRPPWPPNTVHLHRRSLVFHGLGRTGPSDAGTATGRCRRLSSR